MLVPYYFSGFQRHNSIPIFTQSHHSAKKGSLTPVVVIFSVVEFLCNPLVRVGDHQLLEWMFSCRVLETFKRPVGDPPKLKYVLDGLPLYKYIAKGVFRFFFFLSFGNASNMNRIIDWCVSRKIVCCFFIMSDHHFLGPRSHLRIDPYAHAERVVCRSVQIHDCCPAKQISMCIPGGVRWRCVCIWTGLSALSTCASHVGMDG